MPRFSITGPLGPEAMNYHLVPGADPLEALWRLHSEALGFDRVRLEGGRIVFLDPPDRELCAGSWQVMPQPNVTARSVTIEIVATDPADGARAA